MAVSVNGDGNEDFEHEDIQEEPRYNLRRNPLKRIDPNYAYTTVIEEEAEAVVDASHPKAKDAGRSEMK